MAKSKPIFTHIDGEYSYNLALSINSKFAEPIEGWELIDKALTLADEREPACLDYALQIQKIMPDNPILNDIFGNAYLIMKDYHKAEDYIKKYLIIDTSPSNYGIYAKILIGLQKYEEALAAYDKVIEGAKHTYSPEDESWYMAQKARLLTYLGRYEEAIELTEKALTEVAKEEQAYYRNVAAYLKLAEHIDDEKEALNLRNHALQVIEEGITNFPENKILIYSKGFCLEALSKYEEAIKSFKDSVEEKIGVTTLSAMAATYFKWGKLTESLDCLIQIQSALADGEHYDCDVIQLDFVHQTLALQDEIKSLIHEMDPEAIIADDGDDEDPISELDTSTDSARSAEHDRDISSTLSSREVASDKAISLGDKEKLTMTTKAYAGAGAMPTPSAPSADLLLAITEIGASTAISGAKISSVKAGMRSSVSPLTFAAIIGDNDNLPLLQSMLAQMQEMQVKVNKFEDFSAEIPSAIKGHPTLEAYFKAFVDICTSAYISAKAAEGGEVERKASDGIPLVDAIPVPPMFDTVVKVVQSGVKLAQNIIRDNHIKNISNLRADPVSFTMLVKEIALNTCLDTAKQEAISGVTIRDEGAYRLFNKLTQLVDKFLVNNYDTPQKKLAVQDALKLLAYWKGGAYKHAVDAGEDLIKDSVSRVLDMAVESKLLELFEARIGARLIGTAVASSVAVTAEASEPEVSLILPGSLKHEHIDASSAGVLMAKTSAKPSNPDGKKCVIMAVTDVVYDNAEYIENCREDIGYQQFWNKFFNCHSIEHLGEGSVTEE